MIFAHEPLTRALIDEMMPLLREHWKEVAHYQDIPLDVDVETYLAAEASGVVRCYTARIRSEPPGVPVMVVSRSGQRQCADGDLVGYAVYFVRPNPHYVGSIQAAQDVLYLHPSVRGGTGYKFIAWCDEQLRAEGTQVVLHHVKLAHDFGRLLLRQGYEAIETIYAKRLDGGT